MSSPQSPTANPPRWRVLRTPPLDGATNMALDHALMARAVASGRWILRTYAWARPTLSLGRNQRANGLYDLDRLAAANIPVVRRPTGGRAILHDREVTYSVTAPLAAAGALGESYGRINRILVRGLAGLGVTVEVAGREATTLPPGVAPCFDHPAPGELTSGGRKLAGSAQWRDESALLQHGSILTDGDQSLVASLLRDPLPAPPPPATLRSGLGRLPTLDEVADALEQAVRELEDPDATTMDWDEELGALTDERRRLYADDAWTWRR